MGSVVTGKAQAVRLVIACVQWQDFYCESCMQEDWPIPEPYRHVEHAYQRTVVRWLGKNDDFLDAANWDTYEESRNVDIYHFFGADLRSIAREIRSRGLFDESGRDAYCTVCHKRLLKAATPATATSQIEYHKVKIF